MQPRALPVLPILLCVCACLPAWSPNTSAASGAGGCHHASRCLPLPQLTTPCRLLLGLAGWELEGTLCEASNTDTGVVWECPLLVPLDPVPRSLRAPAKKVSGHSYCARCA